MRFLIFYQLKTRFLGLLLIYFGPEVPDKRIIRSQVLDLAASQQFMAGSESAGMRWCFF